MKKKALPRAFFFLFITLSARSQPASVLKDSVLQYVQAGKLEKSLPFARRRAEAEKKEKGGQSPEYANALRSCGDLLSRCGYYTEAEGYFQEALTLFARIQNPDAGLVSVLFQNYGLHSFSSGRYERAVAYYQKAFDWKNLVSLPDSAEVALYYDNMGTASYQMGQYGQAEDWLVKALQIRLRRFGPVHSTVASSYNNLGNFYRHIGDYARASQHYRLAMETFAKARPGIQALTAFYQTNYASNLRMEKNYPESIRQNAEAYSTKRALLEKGHPDLAVSLNSLGSVYADVQGYEKAEGYFRQALRLLEDRFPAGHPDVAEVQVNLGRISGHTQKWKAGDSLLTLALQSGLKHFGESSPILNPIWQEKLILAFQQNKGSLCDSLLLRFSQNLSVQLHSYYPYFTTTQKERYRASVETSLDWIESVFSVRSPQNSTLARSWLVHQMNTKGLMLQSQLSTFRKIRDSRDSALLRLFEKWRSKKEILSRMKTGAIPAEAGQLEALDEEAAGMEKALLKRVNPEHLHPPVYTGSALKRLQKKMRPGDCVVEIVRTFVPVARLVADTTSKPAVFHTRLTLGDSIRYVALIFSKKDKAPRVVPLAGGKAMEKVRLAYYRRGIGFQFPDTLSYRFFWEEIGRSIPGSVRRIFLVPDGVYHFVNPETLLVPGGKGYVADQYEFRYLTNAGELLSNPLKPEPGDWYLIGAPEYDRNPEQAVPKPGRGLSDGNLLANRFGFGISESFSPLPGTLEEVMQIESLVKQHPVRVHTWVRDSASEENMKALSRPGLLHVATHGFFFPHTGDQNQALFRSGLVFNGANQALKSPVREGEDGILTAYEAMNLDLSQTELVVLSACETGLGDVMHGEGVYGLQRAFRVAGARSLIMSLWKVDDEATQELMVAFYRNWQNGLDKATAFIRARNQLRSTYPQPYYWGAFRMVGE